MKSYLFLFINLIKELFIEMRFFIFYYIVFVFTANSFSYRHKEVNKAGVHSLYIGIGIVFPLKNKTQDSSLMKIPTTGIEIIDITVGKNKALSFPAKKIGGVASIGYKMPYFLRLEGKFDFSTFSKEFLNLNQDTDYDRAYLKVRQIGILLNAYIDLDNPTIFTPYIGGGAGLVLNQVSASLENYITISSTETLERKGLLASPYFGYETNAGMIIGSRRIFIDIEGYKRNIPAIKLETRGIRLKAGFII